MDKIRRRKKTLINFAYFVVLIGLFYLFFKYAFWLFAPFLMGLFVAAILQRPVNSLAKNKFISKGLASTVLSLVIYAILLTLVAFLGVWLASEIKAFAEYVVKSASQVPDLLGTLEGKILKLVNALPERFSVIAAEKISSFFDSLVADTSADVSGSAFSLLKNFDFSILKSPLTSLFSTAKQVPTVILGLLITIISTCFITSDYDRLVGFFKRQLPEDKRTALTSGKRILLGSLKNLSKAYLTIMAITFGEMFVGLGFMKLIGIVNTKYIIFVSIITAIVDIFPILGTGTILIPWAVYCLVTGKIAMAIGLIILYLIILVIRQIIEPKLVASNLGLPPVMTLAGMYIGLKIFGVLGIFLVPLIIIMIKLLNDEGVINIFK